MQSGHAIPGRHNAVLFDEEIIRIQCSTCNIFKRGNYQVFVPKLIREHGFDGLDWWDEKLREARRIVKFTRQDLLDKIADYESRI